MPQPAAVSSPLLSALRALRQGAPATPARLLLPTAAAAAQAPARLATREPWIRITFDHAQDAPLGWTAATVTEALRTAEALPAPFAGVGGRALRQTLTTDVLRLDRAGVTAVALRTLPADAADAATVALLSLALGAATAQRAADGLPPPAPVDGEVLRVPPEPSPCAELIALLVALPEDPASWGAVLTHAALADPAPPYTPALLAACVAQDAGRLVLELLDHAAAAPDDADLVTDLVSRIRELDDQTRALQAGGRIGDHAARHAALLREIAGPGVDRDAALQVLDAVAAGAGGPRLDAQAAAAVLGDLLAPLALGTFIGPALQDLVERACGAALDPLPWVDPDTLLTPSSERVPARLVARFLSRLPAPLRSLAPRLAPGGVAALLDEAPPPPSLRFDPTAAHAELVVVRDALESALSWCLAPASCALIEDNAALRDRLGQWTLQPPAEGSVDALRSDLVGVQSPTRSADWPDGSDGLARSSLDMVSAWRERWTEAARASLHAAAHDDLAEVLAADRAARGLRWDPEAPAAPGPPPDPGVPVVRAGGAVRPGDADHPALDSLDHAAERWLGVPFRAALDDAIVLGVIDACFPIDPDRQRWVVIDWTGGDADADQLREAARRALASCTPCRTVELHRIDLAGPLVP